jgi:transposase
VAFGGTAMKAYSMDLRERVIKDCDAGLSTKLVAEKYSVSPAWVRRLKQRKKDGKGIAPRSSRNKRVRKLEAYSDRIRELIKATPDLTLAELRSELQVKVALATLWLAVDRLDLTLKKKSRGRRSRTAPT